MSSSACWPVVTRFASVLGGTGHAPLAGVRAARVLQPCLQHARTGRHL